ncbi:MAG TPA: universal stress protein, partial [Thermomicrobiales bacterium]|nr:universal stress protein [Thermomicrobiales bacterium]
MPGTIVVPIIGPRVDPDKVSEQAIPVARTLADRSGGLVVLVSVMEFLPEFGDLPQAALDDPVIIAGRVDERRNYLEALGAMFRLSATHTEVMQGDPADAILSLLQTFDRPIVVMASHGRRRVKRMTLGSVTFDVVQRATGPVLVVPVSDDEAEALVPVALDRVLIPLDRSPTAETAIDAALFTLGDRPLTVRLVQIVPPLTQRSSQHAARHYATAREVALDYLGRIANPVVARGHDVSTAVAIGSTEDEIAREACEFRAELIVMATRGRTGIGRMLLGSVAEGLTQVGHCPVLVINPEIASLESL